MDVFELRNNIIDDYQKYSTSFTRIAAQDIEAFLANKHKDGHFWQPPLIQINPRFRAGASVAELVQQGRLHPACAEIFCARSETGATPYKLHLHQQQALELAVSGRDYVLTTGTGSGKSLSYFLPLADTILREKKADTVPRIRAIIIYPMNALVNSQEQALEEWLEPWQKDPPLSFATYTGQTGDDRRRGTAERPPDILLTNFMMLEMIMTRRNPQDRAILDAAAGLRYLVLDELHTYRGRQGADVAMLVRRVREALNPKVQCIGTSATMASGGDDLGRRQVVARVSSTLFGNTVGSDQIITEHLDPRTDLAGKVDPEALRQALSHASPSLEPSSLAEHPLARWIEANMGLKREGQRWVRATPISLESAAEALHRESGLDASFCLDRLRAYMLAFYRVEQGGEPFFAFKLHQFISGTDRFYSTLEARGTRQFSLEGRLHLPGHPEKPYFSVYFCRGCGHEYLPVTRVHNLKHDLLLPRAIEDKAEDGDEGFFTLKTNPFAKDDLEDRIPEDWYENHKGTVRLKPGFKKHLPVPIRSSPAGEIGQHGVHGYYLPGNYRFCTECGDVAGGNTDKTRLAGLSNEGRGSATTVLTLAGLKHLLDAYDLAPHEQKILGFTDNRQDASLQAGHFNDFMTTYTLRGAVLATLRAHPEGLDDGHLVRALFAQLGFDRKQRQSQWSKQRLIGPGKQRGEEAMCGMLAYRFYQEQRRGWRYNHPNLEQLDLLRVTYLALDEVCDAEDLWADDPRLSAVGPPVRASLLTLLFDQLRAHCCIRSPYLQRHQLESLKRASLEMLAEPWGFEEDELFNEAARMVPTFPSKGRRTFAGEVLWLSPRSRFARQLRAPAIWGADHQTHDKIDEATYLQIMNTLIQVAMVTGYLCEADTIDGNASYQLQSGCLIWGSGEGKPKRDKNRPHAYYNPYFAELYESVAEDLKRPEPLFTLRAREHTAQVTVEDRQQREQEFREAKLRVMYCSPTMELGVDIKTLNTVYLRNVPPTPANYAQRSGRAGRSGQPALVLTYCAALSPHDQYFYADPARMVAGEVRPPTLDLANEELLEAHLHTLWLACRPVELPMAVSALLDLTSEGLPIKPEYDENLNHPERRALTLQRGAALLDMLSGELQTARSVWYDDGWLERKAASAFRDFDRALERWRELYRAALEQQEQCHRISSNPSVGSREREAAREQYKETGKQIELLMAENVGFHSDFYVYRYLAAEGFLPAYNFPRQPLLAYVPGNRFKNERGNTYLARPRFLAISEFGPQSVIYHEGARYRVYRAIISARMDGAARVRLATTRARLCGTCGYGHFDEEADLNLCRACKSELADARLVDNLFRIQNVSTRAAFRITCEEEERMRRGYEMQTAVRFDERDHRPRFTSRSFIHEGEPLLELQYAPMAKVWRMNLGWRRRKEKSIFGFNIDPLSGEWTRDQQAPGEVEAGRDNPDELSQRVTPFAEDRRNVMILRFHETYSAKVMASLQYALKRGIEDHYQLEESELAVEPLPDQFHRHALLFYEAAEGGAGALLDLAAEASSLRQVVERAIDICHFTYREGQLLPNGDCGAACYRCLLSYYNQPEHTLMDRHDPDFQSVLITLLQAESGAERISEPIPPQGTQPSEVRWLEILAEKGFRQPDSDAEALPQDLPGPRPSFVYHDAQLLIYLGACPDEETTEDLDELGFAVAPFGPDESQWPAQFQLWPDIFE